MARKREDPLLTKIVKSQQWLRLASECPDLLKDGDVAAHLSAAADAIGHLMSMRAIIMTVATLDDDPKTAAVIAAER